MIDIADFGFVQAIKPENISGLPARVTAVQKDRYELICENGVTYAKLKSSVYFNTGNEAFPTTGDFVVIQYNNSGDSQITKTLERKSFFSRRDPTPGRGEQAVAANFDYVFVMASLNLDFKPRRIERYLTLAWQSGATPVVILTKTDLVEDCILQIQAVENIAAGVAVYSVSSKTGEGIEKLQEYLQPRKTIVFLGSSGVGKSSLVNALAKKEIMDVNEIREDDAKGRHTTTRRQLIMMRSGAMIIDTPGMRELGMWDVSTGLIETFSDVDSFLGKCRFSNCKHQSEPGCAIITAIENGKITKERWNSYLKLQKEARFAGDMAAAMREKREWGKSIAKISKQNQKRRD